MNAELASEALARAQAGTVNANYPVIFGELMKRGIPEEEINPRENVLTYAAWQAKGRQVRKGEHGVRIQTWIPVPEQKDAAGKVTRRATRRPWTAVVFHITQTEPRQ